MSGQSFFPANAVPPMCPKCHVRFYPGDTVQKSPVEDGRDPETREHVDCENPQNGMIDTASPVGKVWRRLKGER